MSLDPSGPWSLERVRAHLDEARIPVRLGCVAPSGHLLVLSLWYVRRGDALWCATQNDADLARILRADPRCAFEVAGDRMPYCGVRGWGRAELHPEQGAEVLEDLVDRYLAGRDSSLARWLLSRAEREVAICLRPERLVTWDFGNRMGKAG